MDKSKSKTYTTSDLAKHFNISVVSASRFLVKHNFKPVKTGKHNAKYYDNAVYQQMKKYYQNKPKSGVKQNRQTTKDKLIEQLESRIEEQSAIIELLKQQLHAKDEQIANTTKIANQAQQLDLTTHKQQSQLPTIPTDQIDKDKKHSWLWNMLH